MGLLILFDDVIPLTTHTRRYARIRLQAAALGSNACAHAVYLEPRLELVPRVS